MFKKGQSERFGRGKIFSHSIIHHSIIALEEESLFVKDGNDG